VAQFCEVGESNRDVDAGESLVGRPGVIAPFGLYRGLGPALAVGIGVMLAASLTLTPALLTAMWLASSPTANPCCAGAAHCSRSRRTSGLSAAVTSARSQ
jgi:hypothetical protein